MFLALELLLVSELLAGSNNLVLRLDMRGIGAGRLGVGLAAVAPPASPRPPRMICTPAAKPSR